MMEALLEYLRKRAASTLLISYGVFWCIYHWQGIYVTLFVGQESILNKYNMLKNEYADAYFFGFDWVNLLSLSNLQFILGWILPAIFAYLYVWWLPKWFINPAYRQEVRYRTDRKIDRLYEEKRISVAEVKATEKKAESLTAELDLAKKKTEAAKQDPSIVWDDEYERFINSASAVKALDDLLECIYDHDGYMHRENEYDRVLYSLPSDAKMYADTWGLAKIEQNKISLTDKGRHFAKLYKTDIETS